MTPAQIELLISAVETAANSPRRRWLRVNPVHYSAVAVCVFPLHTYGSREAANAYLRDEIDLYGEHYRRWLYIINRHHWEYHTEEPYADLVRTARQIYAMSLIDL